MTYPHPSENAAAASCTLFRKGACGLPLKPVVWACLCALLLAGCGRDLGPDLKGSQEAGQSELHSLLTSSHLLRASRIWPQHPQVFFEVCPAIKKENGAVSVNEEKCLPAFLTESGEPLTFTTDEIEQKLREKDLALVQAIRTSKENYRTDMGKASLQAASLGGASAAGTTAVLRKIVPRFQTTAARGLSRGITHVGLRNTAQSLITLLMITAQIAAVIISAGGTFWSTSQYLKGGVEKSYAEQRLYLKDYSPEHLKQAASETFSNLPNLIKNWEYIIHLSKNQPPQDIGVQYIGLILRDMGLIIQHVFPEKNTAKFCYPLSLLGEDCKSL